MSKELAIKIDFLNDYFTGQKKHNCYVENNRLYNEMKTHADGLVPECITDVRPGEDDKTKDYRKKIYVPKTKNPIRKVISSLSKIRRSNDWTVRFESKDVPASIDENETPEKYLTKDFPQFKSLEAWVFSVLLKTYCIDANAVVLVMPLEFNFKEGDYCKPYPYIFTSDRIIEFKEGELAILLSTEKASYTEENNAYHDGKCYYVVTPQKIERWNQSSKSEKYTMVAEYPHGLEMLPVISVKGVYKETKDRAIIWESRLDAMIPDLTEAARIYSDFQAELYQHVHSREWFYNQNECTDCKGTGLKGTQKCSKCKGGYVPSSPYTAMQITPSKGTSIGTNAPIPPAGYVQKTGVAEMVREIKNSYNENINSALSSVNMEYLSQVPLSTSGISKEWDRDEANNFNHAVAEDIIQAMSEIANIIIEYRYRIVVPDKNKRQKLQPDIPTPEKFDLVNSNILLDDFASAKKAGVSSVITNMIEVDFVQKKFYTNPEVRDLLNTIFQLDPMPGLTEDEKATRFQNNSIKKEDYILSSNIEQYVKRAIEEYGEDFIKKPLKDKREIVLKYANESMLSMQVKPTTIPPTA